MDTTKSSNEAGAGLSGTDRTIRSMKDCIFDAVEYLGKLHNRDEEVRGIRTGFCDLDSLIMGLKPGELFVIASRPGVGKTAFAMNIATNIAMGGKPQPVGIFSLATSAEQLSLRLMCSRAGVGLGELHNGTLPAARWDALMAEAKAFKSAPIYIDDSDTPTLAVIAEKARQMVQQHKARVIVIDYLQRISLVPDDMSIVSEDAAFQVTGGLKRLARELGVSIIALAHLSFPADPSGKPHSSHARHYADPIQQYADIIGLLHRNIDFDNGAEEAEEPPAELIVCKNSSGSTGIVRLDFQPAFMRFTNASIPGFAP